MSIANEPLSSQAENVHLPDLSNSILTKGQRVFFHQMPDIHPAFPDRKPSPKIGKGTYTALRLYSTRAKNVDIESRVLFVGPIPNFWMKRNRKSWTTKLLKGSFFDTRRFVAATGGAQGSTTTAAELNRNTLSRTFGIVDTDISDSSENADHSEAGEGDEEEPVSSSDEEGPATDERVFPDESLNELSPIEGRLTEPTGGEDYSNGNMRKGASNVEGLDDPFASPEGRSTANSPVMHSKNPSNNGVNSELSDESAEHRSISPLLSNTRDTSDANDLPQQQDGAASSSNISSLKEFGSPLGVTRSDSTDTESFFTARESIQSSSQGSNGEPEPFYMDANDGSASDDRANSLSDKSTSTSSSDAESIATVKFTEHRPDPGPASAREYLTDILDRHSINATPKKTKDDISLNSSVHQEEENIASSVKPQAFKVRFPEQPPPSHKQPKPFSTATTRSKVFRKVTRRKKKSSLKKQKDKSQTHKLNKALLMSSRKLLKSKQHGELVMVEKMLVMVQRTDHEYLPESFNELDSFESRVIDRWKEYIVVVRNTGEYEHPILLQFYKSRYVEKVQKDTSSHSSLDIKLSRDFGVNLYSSLDKTLALWCKDTGKKKHHGNNIYFLRTRSTHTALQWLAFFAGIIGVHPSNELKIGIPDLNVVVHMDLSIDEYMKITEQAVKDEKLVTLDHLKSVASSPSIFREHLLRMILDHLMQVEPLKRQIIERWIEPEIKVGLAWRRYDRLEWAFTNDDVFIQTSWAMLQTYDIEVHPKLPQCRTVMIDGTDVEEPPAIEGFLSRITTWTGDKKKSFFKRQYWHTNDNLLFYTRPIRALPPHPSLSVGHLDMRDETQVKKFTKNLPLYYEAAPFETDDEGNVRWLDGDLENFQIHDQAAANEIYRRVSTVSRCDGVIDLCRVVSIRACTEASHDVGQQNGRTMSDLGNQSLRQSTVMPEVDFELVFGDEDEEATPIVRLRAANAVCRDLWVNRLQLLSAYWKAKSIGDRRRVIKQRQKNLNILHVDEDEEPMIGEKTSKWETDQGVADPYVYNVSIYAPGKSILLQGVLFQKPNKYASFQKYFVILTQTEMLLFTYEQKYRTGSAARGAVVNYAKAQTISLEDCYIYSGALTNLDLLNRDRWFDSEHPGHHALPRVYEDGWKSAEDEALRCFVLWFGKKRPTRAHKGNNKIKSEVYKVTDRLGVRGTSMVFMTRSRQERELWVTTINVLLSRTHAFDNLFEEIIIE